ncbi:MAG: monoamine oxidase [Thermoleophilaceae bacterium]|jgi:monoamine oxidase|nr:monoamine oxidase [Thermoleophilaceae bacterium]
MTDGTLTRRGLLGAGAAGGAGALLARVPDAEAAKRKAKKPRRATRRADVVVIGAGLAGLTAALRIVQKGKSVVLLEARDRVGGRVWNHDLGNGERSERGGTFAGPTQDRILGLAKEFHVPTFPTYDDGQNVYWADGDRMLYSDSGATGTAPPDPQIAADLAAVVARLDQMSTEVPVDAPWETAKAAEYDSQTLDQWVKANSASPRFQRLVPAATRPIFGAEPTEISLLFTLFYIASSGNETNPGTFERNFNTRGGAQESRFFGGSQVIPNRVSKRLGKRVVLKTPVRQIRYNSRGVTVISDRVNVSAKQAIVAIPPALAGKIDFSPRLTPDREGLQQRMPQGTLWKVAARYDKPFWREAGLNGTAVSLNGPVNATFDDSPPDGSPGLIFGFVGGNEARNFARMPVADRRAAVLANFVNYFGADAKNATDYFDTNWPGERWSRGGPVGLAGPGVYTAHGPALRAPVGRIHWAGTETSDYWNGYMDGAVRSGERAAFEVLDAL